MVLIVSGLLLASK